MTIADWNLHDSEFFLCGIDLRFNGPAVVAVAHIMAFERGVADSAEGPKVRIVDSPEQTHERAGEPIAKASLG